MECKLGTGLFLYFFPNWGQVFCPSRARKEAMVGKMKKIIKWLGVVIVIVAIFLLTLYLFNPNEAEEDIKLSRNMRLSDDFPVSYRPYIEELEKKYPNWEFKALYTNLDWKYVIDQENIFGKNLVPKSYSDSWKNTKQGEYNVEVDSGWVDASRAAVEYAMDPRNFLNNVRVFQFEELSYYAQTNTISSIEKILYGTEFYNRIVEYKTSSGSNVVTNKKYSELILNAAKTSKVSGFHLASRIKQEVGPFLSHSSISGTVKGYEGLYNFYNIGATSSSEPMGAIKNGLQYAKDGKGASSATKTKYLIPWNTKERAITGGGIFIGSSYINQGQNTIYLQKFHVYDTSDDELFWHQYMTNVLAPYSESKLIYTGYANSNLLGESMSFVVPVYNNMPELPCTSPAIASSDFASDNTKVYADVETTLNVRTGPSTSYEVLTSLKAGEQMTRIAKGKQKGELWDKVKLQNGMVGYVFQTYVAEVPDKQVEKITLSLDKTTINKGETIKLKATISPSDAVDKTLTYTTSNIKVANVSKDGTILGTGSGKATIKATASNGLSSSIEIKVYSPVTNILIGTEAIILQEEESFTIEASVFPEDADNQNLQFVSQNAQIAQVTEDGTVTGVSTGETVITVTAEEEKITKDIKVTVIDKLQEGEIRLEGGLTANGNELTGLENKNNTVNKMLQKIKTNYRIEMYSMDGDKLEGNDLVGTETTIKLFDENNQIVMEYTVILYGDVNGDGKINSVDLLVLQRHILEIQKLEGALWKAGNVRKNGKNPNSVDCLLIQRHILGISPL